MDDKNSLGISIYGNGGMNTDYDERTFGGSSPTGVDLIQLFIAPTYARNIYATMQSALPPFSHTRVLRHRDEAFSAFSSSPSNLTNNGHESSYGYGARIGYLGEIFPFLNIGAAYQTKIYMSELDDYKGLFAEDGDFDIPATWTVGIALKAAEGLTFLADLQRIYYNDVDSVANPLRPNLQPALSAKIMEPVSGGMLSRS